jgi:hypothetical protein
MTVAACTALPRQSPLHQRLCQAQRSCVTCGQLAKGPAEALSSSSTTAQPQPYLA